MSTDIQNNDLEKRLRPSLFLCRLIVAYLFAAWGYGTLVRPGINSDQLGNFYHISGMPNGVMMVLGVIQIAIAIAVLVGFQKKITRGVLLALAVLGAFMPKFLMAYYIGTIGGESHPSILYFTAFCTLGLASIVFIMRDEDTLWSLG